MQVSLYIPCYNAAPTISKCIKAVLKQTFKPKEILIIDDGSTDNTHSLIADFPVKIIKHDKNKGLAASRNIAINNIKSEFVAALDADCIVKKDWLERLMGNFSSNKVAGVGGKMIEKYSTSICDKWRSVHMRQYWDDENVAPDFLYGANTVFRRKALVSAGLYNERYKTNYEDVDICKKLRKKGYSLKYESKALGHHLKKDNICSILDNCWRWMLPLYQEKGHYSDKDSFVESMHDSMGLAEMFIREDVEAKRYDLLYLDFLLSIDHCLRNYRYFILLHEAAKGKKVSKRVNYKVVRRISESSNYPKICHWLSLLDLVFFFHYDSKKENYSTMLPEKNSELQNFFASLLIIGQILWNKFENKDFYIIFIKHLLQSGYNVEDTVLSERMGGLLMKYNKWQHFCRKEHPNLDTVFLDRISVQFNMKFHQWIDSFPDIVKNIELYQFH